MKRPLSHIIATLGLLALTSDVRGAAPVQVRIQPWGYVQGPTLDYLRISVHIERHPDNRQAQLVLDGDNYSSTSDWTLDGEKAPIYFAFERKHLPVGTYRAYVGVLRGTKLLQAKSEELQILE